MLPANYICIYIVNELFICYLTNTVLGRELHITFMLILFEIHFLRQIKLIAYYYFPGMALVSYLGRWPLGFYPCLLWIILDTSSCSISVHHLCVIAWDRYMAISSPLEYHLRHSGYHRLCYSLLTWVISIVVWIPVVGMFTPSVKQQLLQHHQCHLLPSKWMTTVQCVICYVFPMVLLVTFYSMSLRHLCNRYTSKRGGPSKVMRHKTEQNNVVILRIVKINSMNHACITDTIDTTTGQELNGNTQTPVPQQELSFEGHEQSAFRRQQTLYGIRMLGAVIVVFFACWLPFCISWPLKAHCPKCIPQREYEYTFWMAYINSAINPMLYFIVNKNYRSALQRLWKKYLRSRT